MSACCSRTIQVINQTIDPASLTPENCVEIFQCIIDHGTDTQFTEFINKVDWRTLTAEHCDEILSCIINSNNQTLLTQFLQLLDFTELTAAQCEAISDCIACAIEGQPEAVTVANGALSDGTTYAVTGGTNVSFGATTAGDTRWNGTITLTFSAPVNLVLTPTTDGDPVILNPLTWSYQNGQTPTHTSATRLESVDGLPVIVDSPGGEVFADGQFARPRDAEAAGLTASDPWGTVTAPAGTTFTIRARSADAMNIAAAPLVETTVCDALNDLTARIEEVAACTSPIQVGVLDLSTGTVGASFGSGNAVPGIADGTSDPGEAAHQAYIDANINYALPLGVQAGLNPPDTTATATTDSGWVDFWAYVPEGETRNLSWEWAGEGYGRLEVDECGCGDYQIVDSLWSAVGSNGVVSHTLPEGLHKVRFTQVDTGGASNAWAYIGDALGDFYAASAAAPSVSVQDLVADCDGNITNIDGTPVDGIVVSASWPCGNGAPVKTGDLVGSLFTVNAGDTAIAGDAGNGSQPVTVGDILHFHSSDDSIAIEVTPGSAIVDIRALAVDDPASTELGNLIIEGDDGEEYALPLKDVQCFDETLPPELVAGLDASDPNDDFSFDDQFITISNNTGADQMLGAVSFVTDGPWPATDRTISYFGNGMTGSVVVPGGTNAGETITVPLDNLILIPAGDTQQVQLATNDFTGSQPTLTADALASPGIVRHTVRTYSDGETDKIVEFDTAGDPVELTAIPAEWVPCPTFDDDELAIIKQQITDCQVVTSDCYANIEGVLQRDAEGEDTGGPTLPQTLLFPSAASGAGVDGDIIVHFNDVGSTLLVEVTLTIIADGVPVATRVDERVMAGASDLFRFGYFEFEDGIEYELQFETDSSDINLYGTIDPVSDDGITYAAGTDPAFGIPQIRIISPGEDRFFVVTDAQGVVTAYDENNNVVPAALGEWMPCPLDTTERAEVERLIAESVCAPIGVTEVMDEIAAAGPAVGVPGMPVEIPAALTLSQGATGGTRETAIQFHGRLPGDIVDAKIRVTRLSAGGGGIVLNPNGVFSNTSGATDHAIEVELDGGYSFRWAVHPASAGGAEAFQFLTNPVTEYAPGAGAGALTLPFNGTWSNGNNSASSGFGFDAANTLSFRSLGTAGAGSSFRISLRDVHTFPEQDACDRSAAMLDYVNDEAVNDCEIVDCVETRDDTFPVAVDMPDDYTIVTTYEATVTLSDGGSFTFLRNANTHTDAADQAANWATTFNNQATLDGVWAAVGTQVIATLTTGDVYPVSVDVEAVRNINLNSGSVTEITPNLVWESTNADITGRVELGALDAGSVATGGNGITSNIGVAGQPDTLSITSTLPGWVAPDRFTVQVNDLDPGPGEFVEFDITPDSVFEQSPTLGGSNFTITGNRVDPTVNNVDARITFNGGVTSLESQQRTFQGGTNRIGYREITAEWDYTAAVTVGVPDVITLTRCGDEFFDINGDPVPVPAEFVACGTYAALDAVTVQSAHADDTAAGVAGLVAGQLYQTDGTGATPLDVPGILMVKQ